MDKQRKTCGILGGMGPAATVDLMGRLVRFTEAGDDAGHVRCIVEQNPQVPSRIRAILENGPSPGPILAKMAANLEAAGADFLCMPCNTAHHWLHEIKTSINIPFLDMPALAAADAAKNAGGKKCTILGTTATAREKIYDSRCKQFNMEAVYPDERDQRELLTIIEEVKAGDHGGAMRFAQVARRMVEQGADALIIACTELSELGLPEMPGAVIVDAADSLARAIILEAGAKLKKGHT